MAEIFFNSSFFTIHLVKGFILFFDYIGLLRPDRCEDSSILRLCSEKRNSSNCLYDFLVCVIASLPNTANSKVTAAFMEGQMANTPATPFLLLVPLGATSYCLLYWWIKHCITGKWTIVNVCLDIEHWLVEGSSTYQPRCCRSNCCLVHLLDWWLRLYQQVFVFGMIAIIWLYSDYSELISIVKSFELLVYAQSKACEVG